MTLYIVPREQSRLVIPFHRCRGVVRITGENGVELSGFKIDPDKPFYAASYSFGEPPPPQPEPYSKTIDSTSDELLVSGPGKANLYAECFLPGDIALSERCRVEVALGVAEVVGHPVLIDALLMRTNQNDDDFVWTLVGAS